MKLSDQKQRYSAMNRAQKTFVDIFLNVVYIPASTDLLCVAARGASQGCQLEITKPRFLLWTATRTENAAFFIGASNEKSL